MKADFACARYCYRDRDGGVGKARSLASFDMKASVCTERWDYQHLTSLLLRDFNACSLPE